MMDLVYPAFLVAVLLLSAGAGSWVRGRLHERHTTQASVESIRLMMGMLLTFAALVLGLLTSSAKQRFDGLNDGLGALGAELVELDHRLRMYGPDADEARTLLRRYVAGVIATSWPDEKGTDVSMVESRDLGRLLAGVDAAVERLEPGDGFHVRIAARLRERAALSIQRRWDVIFASQSTISWPFLLVLTSWLSIIFAIFGMTSPRTPLITAVTVLTALSIASPVFLIIDYSQALTGLFQLSSAPMRLALQHMQP